MPVVASDEFLVRRGDGLRRVNVCERSLDLSLEIHGRHGAPSTLREEIAPRRDEMFHTQTERQTDVY